MAAPSEPTSSEYYNLLKKRDLHSKTLSMTRKFLESFDSKTSKTCRRVQIRLDELSKSHAKYEEVQSLIDNIDKRENIQNDIHLRLQEEYMDVRSELLDIIDEFEVPVMTDVQRENSSCTSTSNDCGFLKLPSVPAPTFNGSLQDWPAFIDSFNAMFHNNSNIPLVQKFHYLNSCLTGPAADIIRNIPTTSDNYTNAYSAVISRFDNKSLIIQSHIRSLFNAPKVTSACASDLRKLHHHIVSHVNALKSLEQPVNHWDAWLVTLICCCLDSTTVGEWQLKQSSKDMPTYAAVERFLSDRVSAYEVGDVSYQFSTINFGKSSKTKDMSSNRSKDNIVFTQVHDTNHSSSRDSKVKCSLCAGPHRIHNCDKFLNMSTKEREDVAFKKRLCYNCLFFGHQVKSCRSQPCAKCGKRHHERLHIEDVNVEDLSLEQIPDKSTNNQTVMYVQQTPRIAATVPVHNSVVLATAVVGIRNADGMFQLCRAVLDSGAQVNFISQSCLNRLKLSSTKTSLPIMGIGSTRAHANYVVDTILLSKISNEYKFNVDLHVLPVITNLLPSHNIDISQLIIPDIVKSNLADPSYGVPGEVDILLGAELFYTLMGEERIQVSSHAAFHNTKLGWILTGIVPLISTAHTTMTATTQHVNSALSMFARNTELNVKEKNDIERHFNDNVSRNARGQFVVRLPLCESPDKLGDSRSMAVQRLFNLERRLGKNKYLHQEYDRFMSEYLSLNHMEVVPPDELSRKSYYLPHHAVIKSNSLTTKVRVVFDGSAPSKSGVCLNDIMARGPTVQPDLFSILLRFRVHKYAIAADIEKMYRQVYVARADCDLQRIVYRQSPEEPIVDYRLLTVTYGTRSASYLATKCLSILSDDATSHACARAIREDFYVDDLITGAQSEEDCYAMYTELCTILNAAGMSLRKWCSSSNSLMNNIAESNDDPSYLLQLKEEDTISTLGLTWQPSSDCFLFVFKDWLPPAQMSKRLLLSDMNKVFDPLGLLTPVLIKGKIFLQQLWSMKIDWDSPLSQDLQSRWQRFYHNFKHLQRLSIPRVVLNNVESSITIHGFADASQEAYGACVYVRSELSNGSITVSLFTSRSRVAPLHGSSIPRLELSGAQILTELVDHVISELFKVNVIINPSNVTYWSDSTIVLSWLNTSKPLKVFVANRVSHILDLTSPNQWRHVPTDSNPADLITRGISADAIYDCELWWKGPHWLREREDLWPPRLVISETIEEVRPLKLVLSNVTININEIADRYSTWTRLIRITAWINRFVFNSIIPVVRASDRRNGPLSVAELSRSKTLWLLHIQQSFSEDLKRLKNKLPVSSSSPLKTLNPFVDENGLIRVGGRLVHANMPDSFKYPILLPSKSKLVYMLFEYEHKRLLHTGSQGLLAHMHNSYWPIRGRCIARTIVRRCITCHRANPTFQTPLMAPLPRARVNIERPFTRTGVDFCGPIFVKSGIRRVKAIKAYIAVFVCLTVRAIHLELVSNLTTEAFLASLDRFMSRRGQCAHFYSDNGTNFIGAHKVLRAYFENKSGRPSVHDVVATRGIEWHFNPPASPHFGGLWEAAVKSAKKHLFKVTNSALLNFEETTTLLCRIESILNSRPLTPLSTDPADFNALTPAHFLVGGTLVLPPVPETSETPRNLLKRWSLIQSMFQSFWKRWSTEYLPQLQGRNKWHTPCRRIEVGDLALLKEDNVAVMKWKLVRVIAVHPGPDDQVRVVTVRTPSGSEFKRPAVKLSIVPTLRDEESFASDS